MPSNNEITSVADSVDSLTVQNSNENNQNICENNEVNSNTPNLLNGPEYFSHNSNDISSNVVETSDNIVEDIIQDDSQQTVEMETIDNHDDNTNIQTNSQMIHSSDDNKEDNKSDLGSQSSVQSSVPTEIINESSQETIEDELVQDDVHNEMSFNPSQLQNSVTQEIFVEESQSSNAFSCVADDQDNHPESSSLPSDNLPEPVQSWDSESSQNNQELSSSSVNEVTETFVTESMPTTSSSVEDVEMNDSTVTSNVEPNLEIEAITLQENENLNNVEMSEIVQQQQPVEQSQPEEVLCEQQPEAVEEVQREVVNEVQSSIFEKINFSICEDVHEVDEVCSFFSLFCCDFFYPNFLFLLSSNRSNEFSWPVVQNFSIIFRTMQNYLSQIMPNIRVLVKRSISMRNQL